MNPDFRDMLSALSVDGIEVPVRSREGIIATKVATARPQDLADLDALERRAVD